MLFAHFAAEVLGGFAVVWYVIMMFDVYLIGRKDKIFILSDPPVTAEKEPDAFNDLMHCHRISMLCLAVGIVISLMMIIHDFREIKIVHWG
jgi:hypothetical protein